MVRRWWVIAGVGAVLFALASVVLVTGEWFFECHDASGHPLGGIDCFQYDSMPEAHGAPAAWLGFAGWAIVWLVGVAATVVAAVRGRAAKRRASASAGPA